MPTITEDRLQFDFPAGWQVSKFDDWSFYRNQFSRLAEATIPCSSCEKPLECASCHAKRVAGTKGIDILAIDPSSVCWKIEVKDYRSTRVTNFQFLADEVALKVRDTSACLPAARINANDITEKKMARSALSCSKIRIILHLEQPASHSSLNNPKGQRANVQQRLKQLLKAFDPHPQVVSMADPNKYSWSVTQVPTAKV
jgi:hypothetical protein